MMAEVPWGLRAWMVVVIVGRELLVTALRSFIEDRGSDFSAKMSGKLKMVLQCVAAGVCLFYLSYDAAADQHAADWCWWLLVAVGLVGGGFDGLFRPGLHPRRGAVCCGSSRTRTALERFRIPTNVSASYQPLPLHHDIRRP